jgi:hypothetical protein
MPRFPLCASAATLLLMALLLMSGCASDDWYYDDCCYGYPRVHYFTLVLNVSDQNGEPLGGCTIWLDGEAQSNKTLRTFRTLSDCGCGWEGFRYNWRVNDYRVEIPTWADRTDLTVWVSKPGWENARTRFIVYEWEDRDLLGRATFVMQPAPLAAAQAAPAAGGELPSDRCPAPSPPRVSRPPTLP